MRSPNQRNLNDNRFGETIRNIREAKGLSRAEVARHIRGWSGKTGIHPRYLGHIETGHVVPTQRANAYMVPSLARILEVDERVLYEAL